VRRRDGGPLRSVSGWLGLAGTIWAREKVSREEAWLGVTGWGWLGVAGGDRLGVAGGGSGW
jgi:hypothetical protein